MKQVGAASSAMMWVAIASVAVCVSLPSGARASNTDDVLENTSVVRRQLLLREARHEVSGILGFTLGDPFVRNLLPGARYDFHWLDWLGFGGRLQVGIPVQTSTFATVDEKVAKSNETFVMEATSLQLLATGHVSISPVVGKLLVFDSLPINFDAHIDFSAGVASVSSSGDNITSSTGFGLAAGASGGIRVFLSRVVAISANLEGLLVNRALSVNRDSKEAGARNRFNRIVSFGISFFMPPKLRRAK